MNWLVALLNFAHLFATVGWIGGVVFIMRVFMPVVEKHKELGLGAAILMVDVSKRFMRLVWGCVVLFLITGVPMTLFNPKFTGMDLANPWYAAIFAKHIAVAVMVILGVAQSFTVRRMGQILGAAQTQPPPEKPTPSQPPPEMVKLKRRQIAIGVIVLILGILTLLLTAIAEAAFIPG